MMFWQIVFIFIIASTSSSCIETSNTIVYSPQEWEIHKKICKEKMMINALNHQSSSYSTRYQLERALLTVSGDDVDYIPKVPGAGELFSKEGIGTYQLMHNGVKIIANSYYDASWITDVISALKGHHEPQEEKCFYEILKLVPDNATMVELGAYWAYYSLWFASSIKGAKNYLIEPDPKRLEIGKANFRLNKKRGMFYRGFVGIVNDKDPELTGAEYISIDEFLLRESIEHVHILHADIQGAEHEMLKSCVNSLDKIDYFVISTHDHETHHYPSLTFLQEHDFVILAEHTAAESCSGDGLIVARNKHCKGPEKIEIRKYSGM